MTQREARKIVQRRVQRVLAAHPETDIATYARGQVRTCRTLEVTATTTADARGFLLLARAWGEVTFPAKPVRS